MDAKKGKILIVDDKQDVLIALKMFLDSEFAEIKTLKKPDQIIPSIKQNEFDVILLDMNFKASVNTGNEGIYWLQKILKVDPKAVVVLITAYGDIELAVKAIKLGAIDFVLKPWDNDKLISTLKAAYKYKLSNRKIASLLEKQKHLNDNLNKDYQFVIGRSEVMKDLLKTIHKIAKTEANVLILGENGTGKELIAREIHKLSNRSNEVFISLDMTSLAETLFESELFGHVRGSFTDAKENRVGKFEAASGGTLFLDEIGNLPLSLQAKILTSIQNKEITRIGSNKTVAINIRIICATNKNLKEMIEQGLFREDLYYRINTIQLDCPPLRDRYGDLTILSEHFLKKYIIKYDKPKLKISKTALEKLSDYSWPGNIRELQHTIEKAVILAENDILSADDFVVDTKKVVSKNRPKKIEEMEKEMIREALITHKDNYSYVAKELGISRQTLYNKIKKYDL